jgi:hypothetical protein
MLLSTCALGTVSGFPAIRVIDLRFVAKRPPNLAWLFARSLCDRPTPGEPAGRGRRASATRSAASTGAAVALID